MYQIEPVTRSWTDQQGYAHSTLPGDPRVSALQYAGLGALGALGQDMIEHRFWKFSAVSPTPYPRHYVPPIGMRPKHLGWGGRDPVLLPLILGAAVGLFALPLLLDVFVRR